MLSGLRQRIGHVASNSMVPAPVKVSFLLALVFLCVLVGFGIANVVALVGLKYLYGIPQPQDFITTASMQMADIPAFLFAQTTIMTLGMFLLPAALFCWLVKQTFSDFTRLNHGVSLRVMAIAIGLIIATGVFIQVLVQINAAIPLPAALESLRSRQELADALINALFSQHTLGRMITLTIAVAFLPALSEEIFFRGIIMNVLTGTNGRTAAIVFSGLLFSLMHGEFNNFLAIWWMGIILGYLYTFSGSLWTSILAHFTNNFLMIAGKMAAEIGWIPREITDDQSAPIGIIIIAGSIMCALLYFLAKTTSNNQSQPT
ncbi:MAG: type II CAAX endopeptidase family protein [Chitinophagales bacterium]